MVIFNQHLPICNPPDWLIGRKLLIVYPGRILPIRKHINCACELHNRQDFMGFNGQEGAVLLFSSHTGRLINKEEEEEKIIIIKIIKILRLQ